MNRSGYNLPELPIPAHMPGWAKDLTAATQAVMDAQYLHGPGGLDNFYDQGDGWIQTQTIKRAGSPAPKSYVPEPFKMAIPRRQMVAYDEDGNMGSAYADPDPSIQMPQLPAWVDAPPDSNGGITGHPPASPDVAITQMLAAVMAKLVAIEQRLIAALDKA